MKKRNRNYEKKTNRDKDKFERKLKNTNKGKK